MQRGCDEVIDEAGFADLMIAISFLHGLGDTSSMNENTSWIDQPWLGFDTETTGTNPLSDRLVTAALVLRRGGINPSGPDEVVTWLANPGVEIPESASAVHGISNEKAQTQGRNISEVLNEVADSLVAHWQRGFPVVVFNAAFDITLMNAELTRHGLQTLEERLGGPVGLILDPIVLDRHFDKYRKGKRTLTTMAPHYGVDPDPNAHTAEVDVSMTLDVLAKIAQTFGAPLTQSSAHALMALQASAFKEWATGLETYFTRQGKPQQIDSQWPQRALNS